jgi:hypothetical protein
LLDAWFALRSLVVRLSFPLLCIVVMAGCAHRGAAPGGGRHAGRGGAAPGTAGGGEVASIRQMAARAAAQRGLAPSLVLGVIEVESSFNPRARSHAGARGLMQLMPRTAASIARRLGWRDADPYDPEFNIAAGTYYLAWLVKRFDGDVDLALAAYNAGPVRIARLRRRGARLPRYSRKYIAAVRRAQRLFSGGAKPRPRLAARERHDRGALRALLRDEFGKRPDVPLPR